MNPLSRLWAWLRGLFNTTEVVEVEEEDEDWVYAHYFGFIGRFAECASPVVEICDFAGLAYYPVRVVSATPEYLIFYVLDADGDETGERRVRMLDSIQDVRIDSRSLQLIRLKRMLRTPPPEETNAQDQDEPDPSGVE